MADNEHIPTEIHRMYRGTRKECLYCGPFDPESELAKATDAFWLSVSDVKALEPGKVYLLTWDGDDDGETRPVFTQIASAPGLHNGSINVDLIVQTLRAVGNANVTYDNALVGATVFTTCPY